MPKTFPRFDSTNKKIVYDDRSRKPIEQCERAAKVVDDGEVLVNPPSGLAAGSNELAPGPGGLTDDYPESEYSPPKSTVFDLPSHTDLTSTENGTSKTIYYAGLSVSGVFFTSMVLYKYTALGSVIRSLVSKNEKLRQTTNKHLAQQWLERTSEYMDPNSENAHYNFPYQSMQN
ncbi:Plasmodium vivax Vir protein, putative [Plasmodium vivax]|uniref:Vir protein, putative n=1 Tax=Plasmodium vivax TaxID=5855 RepID=A0A1G4EBN4_PLAVI|nr:Plasmodium vivax Vir protein, putative [Plasmodium vivax]